MDTKLSFEYDREADILYISKRPPYPEQDSEELDDEIIARLNPETGEVENLEVLFFSTRLHRSKLFELPVIANLRLARDTEPIPTPSSKPSREREETSASRAGQELLEKALARWNGNKPTGAKNAPRVEGNRAAEIVVEDRR